MALNDSGWDQTRTVQTSFAGGTPLKDYTGNNPDVVFVNQDGTATIRVPGMNGQGWVCYAPFNAEGPGGGVDPLQFNGDGTSDMAWVVPGGRDAPDKPRTVRRITGDTVTIEIFYSKPAQGGESVDKVLVKWGGGRDINSNGSIDFNGKDVVTGGYEQATWVRPGHYHLVANISDLPEGLHTVKARLFNGRSGKPALFQTFTETVYIDRTGPSLDFVNLPEGATIEGARVVTVENADRTIHNLTYQIDGGDFQQADEIIRGVWRISLDGLAAGSHNITLNATEADFGATRSVINSSTLTRSFTVDSTGPSVAINHAAGAQITEPFFTTTITVPAGQGITANDIKLYWNGYEQTGISETSPGSGVLSMSSMVATSKAACKNSSPAPSQRPELLRGGRDQ